MSHEAVLAQLHRRFTTEEYELIRAERKIHSIAEDNRDIVGLMSTLTDDCGYELVQSGDAWRGKEGATQFYLQLLATFSDVHFDLQNIVIGSQGVFEEGNVTGTHQADWLNFKATGQNVAFHVAIFFPWDSEKKKLKGERVYFDTAEALASSQI